MPRLDWSAVGERFYETGVDRGVLFVGGNPGVPWTGLISVEERPTGGEARPFYLDGYKYLNLPAVEEFEATIEAFSAPSEFGVCDGRVSLALGLFATQQTRKSFGLCYRTLVGNDTNALDHGYKIHLVYNALAKPSTPTYETVNDSPEPTTHSWELTTKPPRMSGVRPTAHLTIDTRVVHPGKLVEIENIIYGSEATSSRMPSPAELVTILSP